MYSLSAIGVETSPICLFSFQLDQSGVYQFKVKVTGQNQAYGYAFINVTVLPGETLFCCSCCCCCVLLDSTIPKQTLGFQNLSKLLSFFKS